MIAQWVGAVGYGQGGGGLVGNNVFSVLIVWVFPKRLQPEAGSVQNSFGLERFRFQTDQSEVGSVRNWFGPGASVGIGFGFHAKRPEAGFGPTQVR